jgi:hypothetical protein
LQLATSTCNVAVDAEVLRADALPDYGSCRVSFRYFVAPDAQWHDGSTVLPCSGDPASSVGLRVVKVCYSETRPWLYVAAPAKLNVESREKTLVWLASGGVVFTVSLLVIFVELVLLRRRDARAWDDFDGARAEAADVVAFVAVVVDDGDEAKL